MSLIFIIFTLLMTIINYFDIMNDKILSIFQIIIITMTMLIGGFLTGKKANCKGYKEGLIIGLIFISFFLIINILLIHNFEFKNILYYIII